ncbi:hypothetical protein HPULCUR_005797 [Helicostylum pulchrum]|uniref:VHS domain-containing protein n=1 Tax=Helicostylum pulchrum TaxID=562976 RepID=A0ABP9Y041_9FUNG
MGFFADDIQKTSVTLYIERLSNLEEVDWYLLQQLSESIQMQESGPREAVEAVRKKLKHGGTQQKLRVLEAENQAVKKELVSLLGAWSAKYKSEPGMHAIAELYEIGRGSRRARPHINTENVNRSPITQSPVTATRSINSPVTPPSPSPTRPEKRRSLPPPRPAAPAVIEPKPKIINKPRSHSSAAATGGGSSSSPTRVFNFEKAKPKIIEEIAVANQNSNNLVNALKLINTSEDRWEIDLQHDKNLQEVRNKCEESKKKIVRYARLVENEEWIGTLLATNEQLLKALDMYDVMLVGEIPAAWLKAQQAQQNAISYYDHIQPAPPKQIRAPPPPPPNRITLPVEQAFSDMQVSKYEEEDLDPFADPVTPIEDENRRNDAREIYGYTALYNLTVSQKYLVWVKYSHS